MGTSRTVFIRPSRAVDQTTLAATLDLSAAANSTARPMMILLSRAASATQPARPKPLSAAAHIIRPADHRRRWVAVKAIWRAGRGPPSAADCPTRPVGHTVLRPA